MDDDLLAAQTLSVLETFSEEDTVWVSLRIEDVHRAGGTRSSLQSHVSAPSVFLSGQWISK